MALFKESDLRARASAAVPLYDSVGNVFNRKVTASAPLKNFDIFLSHSFTDKEVVLGAWLALEDMGYRVYVDWIHDQALSRDQVTKETAEILRKRMRESKSLFFATSSTSTNSKWMPWELGFQDGFNRRAAIFPISRDSAQTYSGQEYLGIYPYITEDAAQGNDPRRRLWVRRSSSCYVLFDRWLDGDEPVER